MIPLSDVGLDLLPYVSTADWTLDEWRWTLITSDQMPTRDEDNVNISVQTYFAQFLPLELLQLFQGVIVWKKRITNRIIKALLIHSCCDSGTTFLHYTSGSTVERAIKTVLYKGPGAWSCLAELVQNPCFPLCRILEPVLWRSSKNEWLFVRPYHFSLPKIHSDPNSENKQKRLWPGYKRRSPLRWIATTIHSSPIHKSTILTALFCRGTCSWMWLTNSWPFSANRKRHLIKGKAVLEGTAFQNINGGCTYPG